MDFYINRSLADLDEAQLCHRVAKANSIIWTVGHIVVGRLRLLTMLGEEVDNPWKNLFGKGSDEYTGINYPPITAITGRHREAGIILNKCLEVMHQEQLQAPALYDLPGTDGTLLSTINYFAFHEAYHIGQVAVLRKSIDQAMPRRTIDRVLATQD